MPRQVTRRDFLHVGAAAGAAALVAACGGTPASPTAAPAGTAPAGPQATIVPLPTQAPATQPPATQAPAATKPAATAAAVATTAPTAAAQATAAPAATGKPIDNVMKKATKTIVVDTIPKAFKESPVLAEQVKAGKLPPVEKRLPENPLVLKPQEIGKYGGTMRVGASGTNMFVWDIQLVADTSLQPLRINPDFQTWEPNYASDCKVSDQADTYTLTLRKGIRWSDGNPMTSKDIQFFFEDILKNTDVTPTVYPYWRPGGKVAEMTAPDDYTVVIKFAQSNPSFLQTTLAHQYGCYNDLICHPSHYLKQFHIKYNAKAGDDAKAEKYESWAARFNDKDRVGFNKDLPTMRPIIVKENTPAKVIYVRNPYFWQVDTEGNQLPYIDNYEMDYLANAEAYQTKVVTGAYDWAGGSMQILNYSAYNNGQQAGNYRVLLWNSGKGGEVFYQVNMNYPKPDDELAKVHQDVRFRRALSMAINRDEINTMIFFGKAIPRQMTVIRQSKFFKPEYEKAWAQYDVAQANKLLDEMGLKWNADKTVRLLPSGKPLEYNFDIYESETPKGPVSELVTEYWQKVGIRITYKSITRELLRPRIMANEEPMSLWHGDASSDILLPIDRKWSTGRYYDESSIAPLWTQWYDSGGQNGIKPPDWYMQAFTAFENFQQTLSPEWGSKLLQLQADNLWSIGTVGLAPYPMIARTNLGNVPAEGSFVWDGLFMYPYHTPLFFFK